MRRGSRRPFAGGFTLVELLFTVALGITILGIAVPAFLSGLEEARTRSAARYLAGRLRLARAIAVAHSRKVGLRFEREEDDYRYTVYEDGDHDGIRTADIRGGIDRQIAPAERLTYTFSGVRFGFLEGSASLAARASSSITPARDDGRSDRRAAAVAPVAGRSGSLEPRAAASGTRRGARRSV